MLKEPRTIISLAQDKNITLQQVVELKSYDEIIKAFKEKIMEKFSRQGLAERFKTYNDLGITTKSIFDYSRYSLTAQKRFKGYDYNKLIDIFNQRHDIVHKSGLPLRTMKELVAIKDFFEKVHLNLSYSVSEKYDIAVEVIEGKIYWGKGGRGII